MDYIMLAGAVSLKLLITGLVLFLTMTLASVIEYNFREDINFISCIMLKISAFLAAIGAVGVVLILLVELWMV